MNSDFINAISASCFEISVGISMGNKVKTSLTLDKDLLNWVDKMVKLKRFATRTHAVEYALQRFREQETEVLHITTVEERPEIVTQNRTGSRSNSFS
jgi:Arc/MetJ-type ribon-helix-helix transcriptional regulator